MHLRPLRFVPFAAAAAFALVCFAPCLEPSAAAAGANDKDALKLHDQAMDDYLSVDFAKAQKKLADALKKCGKDGCSPAVLGKLHIAIGTVHGANQKYDLAKSAFVAALKAAPSAALNKDLTTPELEKAFKEAQKEVGGSSKAAPALTDGEDGEDGEEEPTKKKPSGGGGDLSHTPVAEQTVNTPIPVYVEIPDDVGAAKATLRYKPFGGRKWKSLEMHKVSKGFGVEIPCDDVTTTGDIKYYIIAKDDAGEQLATAGSLKQPHKVPVKNEIEGEAPSLPGKKPSEQCRPKEDCPPGLPGCPGIGGKVDVGAKRGDKGWGASCDATQECKEGLACVNGSCEEGKGPDSGGGDSAPSSSGKRNVISLGLQLDMLVISSSDNVCSTTNAGSYACFDSSTGKQFYGYAITKPGTNGIMGGLKPASVRILAGFDRQLFKKLGLTAGLRIGIAFGGSPSSPAAEAPDPAKSKYDMPQRANSFMPFHLEIPRISYVFGGAPHEAKKLRPYVFASFGAMGQINGSVPVRVCDASDGRGGFLQTAPTSGCKTGTVTDRSGKTITTKDANGKTVPAQFPAKDRSVDAYQITGLNFVALGGGIEYGITNNFGIAFEPAKFMIMFPTSGFAWTPSISPVFAF